MNNNNMWWGYLHENNTIQVKRWFGDHKDYTDDCIGNPFVQQVVKPFEAETYEQAFHIIQKQVYPDCIDKALKALKALKACISK